jgi:hypothetical protein
LNTLALKAARSLCRFSSQHLLARHFAIELC